MSATRSREVVIQIETGSLNATRVDPREGKGRVIFAHGSGSSRLSPRNQFVADVLVDAGFGALLLDLLTVEEDRIYANRFDIPMLSKRLIEAVKWERDHLCTTAPIAFFGASTGAAAALIAASVLGQSISAVVSRGGRPDLAGDSLNSVRCPTLLIVGGLDGQVIDLNREALARIPASTMKELLVVPGATHLFEEPGTLEQVAGLTRDWFNRFAVSM